MEHKQELEALNKKALERYDEYLKAKYELKEEHNEKLTQAKDKWQSSWLDFMDVLRYLETLEI